MKLITSELHIGLPAPVRLLHVTDTHLTCADERDDERKLALSARRTRDLHNEHGEIEAYLNEQIAYAEKNCDLLVHTGDLIDFVSAANVEKARKIVKNEKVFFIAGNHEYSRYVGEAWEDNAYRMNSYMQMGGGFGVPMFYNSRAVGGVNIVAMDNSYYLFAEWQRQRLLLEIEKGLPIILMFHDPLFEESLYDYHMAIPGADCTYLVGCDEAHLLPYSEFRAVQQRPDQPTLDMIDLIKSEPLIKAVLTGHLHFDFESMLTPTLPQYVTDCGYKGAARELIVT